MFTGIVVYTVVCIIACVIVYCHYYQYRLVLNNSSDVSFTSKMPIIVALLVALLFTFFNYYATNNSVYIGGDRRNYILNFQGVRSTPSIGLGLVIRLIHYLGGSIESLYYLTTFSCVFITMIAYRVSKVATPYVLYLLCITQYFLTTLTALKQCYASAFSILFIVLVIEYNSLKTDILAIICLIIACLFHPTGYILIPLFLVLRIQAFSRNYKLYFLFLLIAGVFFKPIMMIGSNVLGIFIPSLANKINQYFGSDSTGVSEGLSVSFLKGIPYYLIVVLGMIKRRDGIKQIANYDQYLICVGTGAFIYFMSMLSPWLGRFMYMFVFVSFVFFIQLLRSEKLFSNRVAYSIIIQVPLIFVTYRFLYLVYSLYGGF